MTNLVDLLYQDTIVYIYLVCFSLSVGLAHTMLFANKNFTLDFEYALFYSVLINFFLNNLYLGLILGGALRLISLLKNSEFSGLQILGTDNDARLLIRLFTNVLSALFSFFAAIKLYAYPGMFSLLYGDERRSNLEDIQQNNYVALYLVLPFITVLINFTVQLYSKRIVKKINASLISIISNDGAKMSEDQYSFSIPQVMVIPVFVLVTFVQSFADRTQRLFFLSPFHIFLVSVVLPMLIILNNIKIKQFCYKNYLAPLLPEKAFSIKVGPMENSTCKLPENVC
jgi:hypothetical protein